MLTEVIGYLYRPAKSVKFDGLLQVWAEKRVAGWGLWDGAEWTIDMPKLWMDYTSFDFQWNNLLV